MREFALTILLMVYTVWLAHLFTTTSTPTTKSNPCLFRDAMSAQHPCI